MTHTNPRRGSLFFGFDISGQLPKYRCFPAAPVVMLSRVPPLSHKKFIVALALLSLIASIIAGYSAIPKRYSLGEHLVQTSIFWTDKEAFFFLTVNTMGQTDNFVLDTLGKARYSYWAYFLGSGPRFVDTRIVAYRLLPSGELQQLPLPVQTAGYGEWILQDGQLQYRPTSGGTNQHTGFRWNGEKFVLAAPQLNVQMRDAATLNSDDHAEDGASAGFLTLAAGWHYKHLTGYETKTPQATVPISLGKDSFDLTITKLISPKTDGVRSDLVAGGVKSLEISRNGQQSSTQALWNLRGMQTVSRRDFEERIQHSGQPARAPYMVWIWAVVFIFFTLLKLSGWGYLLLNLLGVKRRVLKNMPTSYSFPPTTPSQFPRLDTAELDRYTREFESLGFVRLLDFSLVSDAAKQIPNFCRLFAHTRNHCFAEVSQPFPHGKAPMPVKCSIQGCLQNDWTLAFSDRKPQAASSLLRRKKALGVCIPGSTTYELLQAFLQMRDQMCTDLGISYLKDDSWAAYIAKTQRAAMDMREALEQTNFATGISEVYYRKFSLLKTKSEYLWLGDYPKEAERRKQGFPTPVRAT
jgi:hypothetical protein